MRLSTELALEEREEDTCEEEDTCGTCLESRLRLAAPLSMSQETYYRAVRRRIHVRRKKRLGIPLSMSQETYYRAMTKFKGKETCESRQRLAAADLRPRSLWLSKVSMTRLSIVSVPSKSYFLFLQEQLKGIIISQKKMQKENMPARPW